MDATKFEKAKFQKMPPDVLLADDVLYDGNGKFLGTVLLDAGPDCVVVRTVIGRAAIDHALRLVNQPAAAA